MKLNLEQIRKITQGAEQVWQQQDAIYFSRFTEDELALYQARPEYYPAAAATPGIQLVFRTDATGLELAVTAPDQKLYRRYYAYDILVEDTLIGQLKNFPDDLENGHYDEAELSRGPNRGYFPLGSGEKTLRIVFPWSVSLGLEVLNLENATYCAPVKKARKLLVYGDSITQGACTLFPSGIYPLLLGKWLEAETISKGVGSEFYYPELAERATLQNPDFITVAYGCNDWYHLTREEFTRRCRAFWEILSRKYPDSRKFALTPIWYLADYAPRPFGPLEEVADTVRSTIWDLPDITVIDCLDFVSRDHRDFGDLYVHPNHLGFEKYFHSLKQAMEPYL